MIRSSTELGLSKRWVIKIGSSLVTNNGRGLNTKQIKISIIFTTLTIYDNIVMILYVYLFIESMAKHYIIICYAI